MIRLDLRQAVQRHSRAGIYAPAPRRALVLHDGAVMAITCYIQQERIYIGFLVVRAADGVDELLGIAYLQTGEVDNWIASIGALSLGDLRTIEPLGLDELDALEAA